MSLISIKTTCPICNKEHIVNVQEKDWDNYKNNNELVQNAFPYLTADERELLITGICNDCWNNFIK